MITISKSAAAQIRASFDQSCSVGMSLRIAAKRGADGSIDYAMGFDEADGSDSRVTSEGIEILVAPASQDLLDGVLVDYVEFESGQFHFIFENPNDPHYVPPKRK